MIITVNFKKEYYKVGLLSLSVTVLMLIHSFLSVFNLSLNSSSIQASIGLLIIMFLCLAKFDQIKKEI